MRLSWVPDFVEKLKEMKIKESAKDQPSYRMIQSIDVEALTKRAADDRRGVWKSD
jgi:hypothetical protein